MRSLQEYTRKLMDLRRQHDIISCRYYNRNSEAIILKLITEELSKNSKICNISNELYFSIAKIDSNNSLDIETLCIIYRKLILLNSKE